MMAEEHQNPDTAPLVADDNVGEEIVDDGDSAIGSGAESDTSSLRSSILRYRQENGRTYHAYKDGVYVLPNDEIENERLDLQHHLFLLTFDEKLHAAPLTKPLHRVFDAGCGTGIWAIEFADEHPECQVTGVDLSPIQPQVVPPNVTFYVDDLEESWDYSTKFDYIFARFLTGSIRDWPKFFRQSFEFLNPGGTIELIDIVYPLQCDDGTLAEDSPLYKWSKLLLGAFTSNGSALDSAVKYKVQLEEAGFIDVTVVKRKWPLNRWPKDPKHKQIGIWAHENTMDALAALSLAVFTRPVGSGGLGWGNEELEVFLAAVRKDIDNLSIHSYWPIWSVYATKPE
ncbi:S-adenosyl-L-methionine-dependent methyltransferase [Dactylonectria estremocensis]|uniref:S-adenosyl-L-methionine-dependent methyltransferase n=1 Tax=Dactylonectria estremocensis TaxID=1079267 RepID=A0A9P9ENI8_9HYPO|nr:S-adenosyl-L-methionine-dependent methyltransferase [Dactylonectria estremocensis]